MPALARGHEALPVPDGEIDRSQGARAQNRSGNDNSRAGFLVYHKICADCQHAGLQHHTQHFRRRAEPAAGVTRFLLTMHVLPVGLVPSCGDPPGHTHGDQCFRVASAGLRKSIAENSSFRSGPRGRSHENFSEQGQRNKNNRSCQRG